MKVLNQKLRQFSSDLSALDEVLAWFNQLNQPCIPINVWLQCELALAEWFTNVVRHAHLNLSTPTPINIEVSIFSEYLEIRIWDQGKSFDLEQYFRNLPDIVNPHTEGGRGIPILYQIADKLSYMPLEDGGNCLLIVKHYHGDKIFNSPKSAENT